jgi:ABC-type transport system substrate-binding protein
MKIKYLIYFMAGWTAFICPMLGGVVEVDFNNTDNYADIEVAGSKAYAFFAREMTKTIEKVAEKELPPDSTLSITFTQVDLAGAYEPWHGPDFNDIRIYKNIYPPRLEFTYQLVADDGQILKEGKATLTDNNYQRAGSPIKADTVEFYYEKELIKEWVKKDLAKFAEK